MVRIHKIGSFKKISCNLLYFVYLPKLIPKIEQILSDRIKIIGPSDEALCLFWCKNYANELDEYVN